MKNKTNIKGGNKMEQSIKTTDKQAELWRLADFAIRKIGGVSMISRNPDQSIRRLSKTEGTREWALLESTRLVAGFNDSIMTDEYCQKLINIIKEIKE